jgi:hypothetical protein
VYVLRQNCRAAGWRWDSKNSKDNELIIHHYDEALAVWDVENENERPTIPQFQKNWDNINIKRIIANDLIFNSPRDLARFRALQCRESGSWLHAIPSPNIGTLLDNTSFQVCIGLRLGCNLCTPCSDLLKASHCNQQYIHNHQ